MNEQMQQLSSRTMRVLEAVINGYLSTGDPVGSMTVVRNYNLKCSPATVRTEMARLGGMGYLTQTHVSSGRVPTSTGVRYYLDQIMHEEKLSLIDIEKLHSSTLSLSEDYQVMVRNTGRTLAEMTRQAGVILMPGLRHLPMRRIEFTKLTSKRIVALLVSEGGRFFNRVFDWGEELEQQDLTWASNYLNEKFKGKTLAQIRKSVISELREEKARYDKMLAKALGLMETVFQQGQLDEEVFIEGRENLVEKPEFADSKKIIELFKTFKEMNFIAELLSKALEESKPVVLLSNETGMQNIPELAIIMARYGTSGPGGGTLGIIGPMRMNYSRVIPIVRYAAEYVSDILNA